MDGALFKLGCILPHVNMVLTLVSLFLYRIPFWFKDSITIHNPRSKISNQLSMIEFTQSKTLIPESYTLLKKGWNTRHHVCECEKILFCQTPTRSQKRQRDPKSPTRPEVKICALQQQDVISLCSRQITVLLLAVVFINSRH